MAPFLCIKLIGCGFDGEVLWLRASRGASDKHAASEFMNNKKGKKKKKNLCDVSRINGQKNASQT